MNLIKEKYQQEAFDAAEKSGFNCTILASVGSGKGRVMCMIIEALYKKGIRKILYCCDNQRLRDEDFPNELQKWLTKETYNNIQIDLRCYQACYKWTDKEYDLLLADEFDFSLTPEYIKIYHNNKFKHKILLSGTLSGSKKRICEKIAPIVYELMSHEAEKKGVINKTEYYIYNFKMSDTESEEYHKLTNKIKQLLKIQTPFDDPVFQYWLRTRKGFLSTLNSSVVHCKRIIKFLENHRKENRIVIFCERTEQADRVCEYSFHGQNEKDDMLSDFQAGTINKIAVVAKVKRGINLVKTNCCIYESLSGSSTEWEQRSGRLKRLPVSQVAVAIFMQPWVKTENNGKVLYKQTVVKDWINRATSNIPNINFKTLKI